MEIPALSPERVLTPRSTSPRTIGTQLLSPMQSMLRELSATSEGFAYGSTALTSALHGHRRAIVAANLADEQTGAFALNCWRCDYDEHGIALEPMTIPAEDSDDTAERIVGTATSGGVLVACDPWGEHDVLCRAVRLAFRRGVTTIAVTGDQPNLLAALAGHAVRVPAAAGQRLAFVVGALEHFIQTAGNSLVPKQRRVTAPLRPLEIGELLTSR